MRKPKEFKEMSIPIKNSVLDRTKTSYLKTIVDVGLYELDIDSSYVIISKMPESMKNSIGDEFEMKASIIGEGKQFMMYVDDMDRMEAIKIISHELIHLEQYQSGRLVKLDDNKVLWEGKVLDVKKIPYMKRPWEIEAHKKDNELEKKIKNMLLG